MHRPFYFLICFYGSKQKKLHFVVFTKQVCYLECWLPGETRLLNADEEVQWHAPANRIAAAYVSWGRMQEKSNKRVGRKRQTVCVANLPWASTKSVCLILLGGVFATNHCLYVCCFFSRQFPCYASHVPCVLPHIERRSPPETESSVARGDTMPWRAPFIWPRKSAHTRTHVICEAAERKKERHSRFRCLRSS
jgi:hypothetical protein